MDKIIDVAAGLVFRKGKLLITQRFPNAHLGGFWEFPGGKRETSETFEDCLHRELTEELSIEVQIISLVEAITHHYPEKSVHLKFFRCQWLRHEPRPLGCHDLAWITQDDLPRYTFPPADDRLLEKVRAQWESLASAPSLP